MSQQHPYPPQQHAGGGRGRGGPGGRGGGHPMNHYSSPPTMGAGQAVPPQATPPPYYGAVVPGSSGPPSAPSAAGAGAGSGRIGAWQPAAPTSSLQAAAMQSPPGPQSSPYGHQQQQQQGQRLPSGVSPQQGQPTMPPGGGYPGYYNPYAANPYAPWQPAGAGGGPPPPHMYPQPQHQHPGMRGGQGQGPPGGGGVTYYPQMPPQHRGGPPPSSSSLMATPSPSGQQQQPPPPGSSGGASHPGATPPYTPGGGPNAVPSTPLVQAPKPRRPLVITDKAGNVIDLTAAKKTPTSTTPNSNHAASSLSAAAAAGTTPPAGSDAAAKSTSPVPPNSSSASAAPVASAPSAGDKLRQAALERMKKSSAAASHEEEEAAKKKKEEEEDAEKAKREAEEEKARLLAEEEAAAAQKKKDEEELAAKKRQEEEEKAKKEAEEKEAAKQAEEAKKEEARAAAAASSSSLASAAASGAVAAAPAPRRQPATDGPRIVYSKDALLKFRTPELIKVRPESLPDMTIVRGPSRGKSSGERGGGGGGGGGSGRQGSIGGGPPRRQSSTGDRPHRDGGGGGPDWARGQSQPKGQNQNQNQNRGRQRSGRGPGPLLYDGPVAPLVKSANHWKPRKNDSALIVAEKQVKAILNKMTKEKFDRLSNQMLEIRIESHEILNTMIKNVFDKAIDEPSFGDMYADLCVKLSKSAKVADFIHVIESDEEPPTEDGAPPVSGESSSYSVYRWSSSIGTADSDVVGPFNSEEECYDAALTEEDEVTPVPRGDMELELVSVSIKRGIFVKILKKKNAEEGETGTFYAVYFPVSEAAECGQQLSEIFLSEVECRSDATKKNSFKRTLLDKCQDEFDKQDIYVDWKKEKAEYEAKKSSMKEAERAEREEELDFRRIRIKKQMLGNVKFIGQLYKKNLLKEKIMRLCIAQLLKLKEIESSSKNPEYKDDGDMDLDEEDHEAICSIFITIGATIDTPSAASFMNVCFTKIKAMSVHKSLPSRSRFMYKDLIELRSNNWVPRRKEEKAKTLEEIRQDVEREERRQAQLSQQSSRGGPGGAGGGGGRGGDFRQSRTGRGDSRPNFSAPARPRQVRPQETDDDGFTTIASSRAFTPKSTPTKILKPNKPGTGGGASTSSLQRFAALEEEQAAAPVSPSEPTPEPLSKDQLERRIKSIRSDYMSDGGDVVELLRSIDDVLAGNRDAGKIIVEKSVDQAFECKDDERDAIVRILSLLFEKGKVSKSDVEGGLGMTIEYIGEILPDVPRAYEYLSQIVAELLRVKATSLDWVCGQLEKAKSENPQTKAPEQVLRHTLSTLKKTANSSTLEAVVSSSKGAPERLVGAENWMAIYKAI